MNDCKRIRSLIDEADRPGVLSYEAEGHISDCADCKAFADERASLRALLASAPRIAIPTNYDALLRAKLDESRRVKTFSWFSPAGYMQIGAAAAGIIIAIVATQYLGIFSEVQNAPTDQRADAQTIPLPVLPSVSPSAPPSKDQLEKPEPSLPSTEMAMATVSRTRRGRTVPAYSSARDIDRTDVDPGFVILMGQDGETRVSVPMVGVGAQPLLMSSAPMPVSTTRTAF